MSDFAVVDFFDRASSKKKQNRKKNRKNVSLPPHAVSLLSPSLVLSRYESGIESRLLPLHSRGKGSTHVQIRRVALQPEPAPLALDADVEVSATDSLRARDEDGDVAERLGPLVGDAAVGEGVLVSAGRGEGVLSGHELLEAREGF